jgi:NADPH2:quinone reductase
VVVFGNASTSAAVALDSLALWFRNVAVLSYSIGHLSRQDPALVARQARAAMAMVADGRVTLDITDVLPLAEAREAHRRLEGRGTVGKLLLAVAEDGRRRS